MRSLRYAIQSLRFYLASNLATLLGIAIGTAVVTGALVVGDSIKESLKQITLHRLGRVDSALVASRFVHEDLAAEVAKHPAYDQRFGPPTPAILMQASAENADTSALANKVNIIGVRPEFWNLAISPGSSASTDAMKGRSVVVNAALARELNLTDGSDVLLRLDKPENIPTESVAGRKAGRVRTLRLKVSAVAPNEGLGRFSLFPAQQTPLNAFVPLAVLQRALEQEARVNAILVPGLGDPSQTAEKGPEFLAEALRSAAHLEDLGLRVQKSAFPNAGSSVHYVSVESLSMLLTDVEVGAIQAMATKKGAHAYPALTYLANSISLRDRETPYSTVSALDFETSSRMTRTMRRIDGLPVRPLHPGETLINQWLADDLAAQPGDSIRLTYFVEGPTGQLDTASAEFKVAGVIAMEGVGFDQDLTPDDPGIQNATRMTDWDPPFPVDLSKVRPKDEEYWKTYKATPKAFITLDRGLELWKSRFGSLTSLRIPVENDEQASRLASDLSRELRDFLSPEATGLVFQPVKKMGLASSAGATDFSGLFIGFSFFIILSALMLVRLFFSLSIQRRAGEIGLLMAVGYPPASVRRRFLTEGMILSVIGGLAGVGLGVGYAGLMIHGLRTWWVGAVGTTLLELFVGPPSLVYGWLAGVVTSFISIYLGLRWIMRADPAPLLAGNLPDPSESGAAQSPGWKSRWTAIGSFAIAALALAGSFFVSATQQAALFYVCGLFALTGALAGLSLALRQMLHRGKSRVRVGLTRLGVRNAARNASRSVLTVALMASATLIIVAVGANRHDVRGDAVEKKSGNGGYALMAEASVPLLANLNDTPERTEAGIEFTSDALLRNTHFYPLRMNPGQDSSCLNLYRSTQPRVLGAPEPFMQRGGFKFSSSLARTSEEKENPWLLLHKSDGPIPVIADVNTVMWILHSGLGKTITIHDEAGQNVEVMFVGLLKSSALQSEIVMSEPNFMRLFPRRGGYPFYFIECPPALAAETEAALESGLREYGFGVFSTQDRINQYLAVENTYLATFQALGALGLLLGTFGLAAVMLRNVFERRKELALLRAVGYDGSQIGRLVLGENLFLLFCGLGIGTFAALLSIAPHAIKEAESIPWMFLAFLMLLVIAVGLLSGLVAVWSAIRSPVIESLRSE